MYIIWSSAGFHDSAPKTWKPEPNWFSSNFSLGNWNRPNWLVILSPLVKTDQNNPKHTTQAFLFLQKKNRYMHISEQNAMCMDKCAQILVSAVDMQDKQMVYSTFNYKVLFAILNKNNIQMFAVKLICFESTSKHQQSYLQL